MTAITSNSCVQFAISQLANSCESLCPLSHGEESTAARVTVRDLRLAQFALVPEAVTTVEEAA